MKIVREHINEKFVEDSDPIHDMDIGLQGNVYICGDCDQYVDDVHLEPLEGEDLEYAEAIHKSFGEKRVNRVLCANCWHQRMQQEYEDEMRREEERYREREYEEELRREEEEREARYREQREEERRREENENY